MVDEKIAQQYARDYAIALDPKHPEHLMPDVPPHVRSMLDVGCGAGQTLAAIQSRYPHVLKLVGIDCDEKAIAWGHRHWPDLTLFAMRGEDLFMMARYYDMVLARFGLPYMEVPRVVSLMARGLRPYGRMWLVTQTWRSVVQDGWRALLAGRFARVDFSLYVLANGIYFHLTGRLSRCPIGGRLESFQTERRMRALLHEAGCRGITYERRGAYAVITAEGR